MHSGEEKSRRLVHTGLARCRWVLPRSVGRVGGASALDVNGESAEEGTIPVDGNGVKFLQVLDEVVGVLFSDVLDAKVVNNVGEKYGLGVVLPQRRVYGYRGETELGEVSFESVVGDAAGLLED